MRSLHDLPTQQRFCLVRGRSVTALGVIFDFTGNDVNTTVQKVEDMVNEQWVSAWLRVRGVSSTCSQDFVPDEQCCVLTVRGGNRGRA